MELEKARLLCKGINHSMVDASEILEASRIVEAELAKYDDVAGHMKALGDASRRLGIAEVGAIVEIMLEQYQGESRAVLQALADQLKAKVQGVEHGNQDASDIRHPAGEAISQEG